MFVWFLKEKGLVPPELFDKRKLLRILKNIDDSKSTFYKAILQNLFFATLNTEMGKRKFRSKSSNNRDGNYFIHNVFRYEDYFTSPNETLKAYFENIPFLNGGLFECLDKELEENGKLNRIRIDGFSDREDNPVSLPNEYFFCEREKDIDLNEVYATKNKKYKFRGIIDILNSYKFTIAENTPIEEEIALDPELLGKVFENLLANYNPETQTTARKQTGSFYTPREIVNYMVDESLIAYLNQQLDESDDTESKLRNLISYSDSEPEFNSDDKSKLINAIDNIKILDPACGSGAFPMGILHKLVHILHKLDPKNKLWKQRQIDKASQIDDAKARDAAIDAIEEAFENNELDYGRKLYLIENCIFGVDIQPIAAQISKLRFFISLIVEQKANSKHDNFGIRALPNLETKFVAANTLIGLEMEKDQRSIFENPEIEKIKEELKKVRHSYFEARTPKTKEKYKNLDKELREKLAVILENEQYLDHNNARRVSSWNPYDQNFSVDFFEPEWMFGLKDGFDVVIGNPPWGAKLSAIEKDLFKRTYKEIDSSTPNTFAYFIGWAYKNFNCTIYYVLPDSILIKDYSKTRYLINERISEIVWYENSGLPEELRPFVYVDHDVCIINIQINKSDVLNYTLNQYDDNFKSIQSNRFKQLKNKIILEDFDFTFNLIAQEKDYNILSKLQKFEKLDSFMQCHEGIHTGNSREILFVKENINKYCHSLFYGGGAGDIIQNYHSKTSGWYVDYRNEIINKTNGFYASLRDERIFKFPKIYITRTGNPFKAFYDDETYASNNFFSLQHKDYSKNDKTILKFVLPFIISKISQYFIRTFAAPRLGSTFIETKIFHLLKFRLPINTTYKDLLINLVEYILYLKQYNLESIFLERLIDAMVYELYFPDEIKAANA